MEFRAIGNNTDGNKTVKAPTQLSQRHSKTNMLQKNRHKTRISIGKLPAFKRQNHFPLPETQLGFHIFAVKEVFPRRQLLHRQNLS